ncbi:nad-dependent epimerase dehydratase [Stylonychia lemnae]|uniref:Nad-dependent epimerase dehydratase n=1 Tax=Stylonychia lemnae TaxID=5949 RepID=A0A078APR5_STYLE|nr:nad-dependent epimerase dehydratase [Stylonychia lemnae]|eukprot:CDW83956.1 nad-dependent epimerase dehydratase [Stylonychia lemnae]
MESLNKEIILITGITGYLGSWVAKTFVEKTNHTHRIRASTRSLQKIEKLMPLKAAFGNEEFEMIEFVEADLSDKQSLFNAVQGVSYIIHVASPLPGQGISDREMISQAQEGMKFLLDAAVQNKVKKIVVTSSLATIQGNHFRKSERNHVYDENDFAPIAGVEGYIKSKIVQEHELINFLKHQCQNPDPSGYQLEICTIHPTFILGPSLIKERHSSIEAICRILNNEIPAIPKFGSPAVDVRDVALLHYLAFEKQNIQGERFLATQETISLLDIANILKEEFQPQGYKVQTKLIGYCPLKLASYFNREVKSILPFINENSQASNIKSIEVLGMKYTREMKQIVIDMGYSIIEKGLIPDKRKNSKK